MFEAFDDPTPPVALESDALRMWRKGRNRVHQRIAVAASTVVVAVGGGFALVNQSTPDAVVSNTTHTTPETTSSATTDAPDTTLTTGPAFGGGPLTGDAPATTDTTAPPSTPRAPSDPSAPAPTTPPPATTPAPGSSPVESPEPTDPPSVDDPVTDPGPPPTTPPFNSNLVWTATQSVHEIEWGTIQVMDIEWTVRNNNSHSMDSAMMGCDPYVRRMSLYASNPSKLYPDWDAGVVCENYEFTVAGHSEVKLTLSIRLMLGSGFIPPGDYTIFPRYQEAAVTLRVLPKS